MGFDDERSLRTKVSWLKTEGFGGGPIDYAFVGSGQDDGNQNPIVATGGTQEKQSQRACVREEDLMGTPWPD